MDATHTDSDGGVPLGKGKNMFRQAMATSALISTLVMTSPAFAVDAPPADPADAVTIAAMQAQCDLIAAAYGPSTGPNDHYSADVVEGATSLVSGPSEVSGSRDIDESSIQPTGTYVPGQLYIATTSPYKTGGSVNMFGDQWSSAGYYPGSTYNYTADFDSTFSHAFSCEVMKETYHAPVYHPPVYHPRTGLWSLKPDFRGNEEQATENCNAFNTSLPAGPAPGIDGLEQANCIYTVYTEAFTDEEYTDPEYWDDPVPHASADGTPVNQPQTDSLGGFEPNGPRIDVTAEYFVGKTVICISPGSKGGSWRAHNGYGGGSMTSTNPATPGCNTAWFKVAPTNSGTTQSQGTFTSVPDYNIVP